MYNINSIDELSQLKYLYQYKYIVLKFYAKWCKPCTRFNPHFHAMEKIYKNLCYVNINIDKNSELCNLYDISSVPTILFLKRETLEVYDTINGFNVEKLNICCKKYN